MAIKSVQAIVNGVTTTLTYDSASKTYKATLTAPAKSSYNQSGHYYGVQIIAKDEAGNTTTVNQSDATLGSKLRLTVKEKTAPVITISSPTASQLLTSNQPTISFTVTDDDSGVNPDTIKLLIDGSEISGITKTKTTSGYSCSYKPSTALSDGSHTVVVKASDYDGNAATQKSVSFKIDTVPPELSVTSPVNKLVTNKTTVTVAGTTNDATSSPVTLTINGYNPERWLKHHYRCSKGRSRKNHDRHKNSNPRYKSTGYLRCFIGTEPGGCRSNLCNFCFGNRLGGAAWQLTYW